jgi:DNA primase large subunit
MQFLLWSSYNYFVIPILSYIRLGTGDLAKYPFLSEASEYIRQIQLDYEEFDRPEMKYIIDRAAEKLNTEITKGKVFQKLDNYEIEILTFLVTLIMVKCLAIETIFKKHSLFEALRAERFLIEDLKKEESQQKRRLLLSKVFTELFKVEVEVEVNSANNRLFKVKVNDYLERASKFHEQEWKLINRSVYKGYVYLDANETVRLIRNELNSLIYNRIKSMDISGIPQSLRKKLLELSPKFVQNYTRGDYDKVSDYPPCVKHAIDEMSRGENLPHSARVLLATYMLAIGKNIDDIVMLFQNAPDFNEKITRYQIEHLAGNRGSRTKYFVPSCEKIRNESLCFATQDCSGIVNPIQFGQRLRKRSDFYERE